MNDLRLKPNKKIADQQAVIEALNDFFKFNKDSGRLADFEDSYNLDVCDWLGSDLLNALAFFAEIDSLPSATADTISLMENGKFVGAAKSYLADFGIHHDEI